MLERRFLAAGPARVGIETREDGGTRIVGYAAVFYDGTPDTEFKLWDDCIERIMPGAFDEALAQGQDVRALFNHNPDYVLGRTRSGTLSLSVDAVGLRYEITTPDTQVARDLMTVIGRGDVSGSSFAFFPAKIEWETEGEDEIRKIISATLDGGDVSPVTYPAYEATTTGVRDGRPDDLLRREYDEHMAKRRQQAFATAAQRRKMQCIAEVLPD